MLMAADKAHASEISPAVWPFGGRAVGRGWKYDCSEIEEALNALISVQLSQHCAPLQRSQTTVIPQRTTTKNTESAGEPSSGFNFFFFNFLFLSHK